MPELSQFIPFAPLHWTSIFHYILLLGALYLLLTSGDDTSVLFLFVIAVMGGAIGASLYADLFGLNRMESGRLVVFLLRVVIFAVPALVAGLGTDDTTRMVSLVLAVFFAIPIVAIVFFTCPLGPGIGDPRIIGWCY